MLLTLLSLTSSPALATVPDTYGIGSANIGRGSAMTAVADDPYATYYNPAGLGQIRKPTVTAGYLWGGANLQPFQAIVYDTNGDGQLTDADGYPDRGPVGTDYAVRNPGEDPPSYTGGLQVGMAFPLLDQWLMARQNRWLANRRLTFGLSAYLPTASTLRMEMQDPGMPYYVMFRNRNNRFGLYPGVGLKMMQGVYLGAGTQMMFKTNVRLRLSSYTTVDSFPSDSGEGEDVDVRIQANVDEMVLDLQPTASYNWGVLIRPAELWAAFQGDSTPRADNLFWNVLSHTALGATGRGEWGMNTSADVTVLANGQVSFDDETLLLSALLQEPVEIALTDLRSMYNPPQVAFGLTTGLDIGAEHRAELGLAVDATRTAWSRYTETAAPYQQMTIEALAGSSVTVTSGTDYGDPGFVDTMTLRTGVWWNQDWTGSRRPGKVLSTSLRGGYSFVPSPVPDQTGLTNMMDSDRHVFSGGLGVRLFPKMASGPIELELAGQYHQLETRTVRKQEGLASDSNGDGFLDYPRGYPLEGEITSAGSVWVIGAGATMQFGFAKAAPASAVEEEEDRGRNPAHDLLDREEPEEPEAPPPPAPADAPPAPPQP